jgi:hypothetical protein
MKGVQNEHLFGYFIENRPYCQDQILPAVGLMVSQFCLHGSKGQEVIWCIVCAMGRMRHSTARNFVRHSLDFLECGDVHYQEVLRFLSAAVFGSVRILLQANEE